MSVPDAEVNLLTLRWQLFEEGKPFSFSHGDSLEQERAYHSRNDCVLNVIAHHHFHKSFQGGQELEPNLLWDRGVKARVSVGLAGRSPVTRDSNSVLHQASV